MPFGESQSFSASFETRAKIISGAVVALLICIGIVTRIWFIAAWEAAVLLLAYAWSARGYAVAGGTLIIRRLIGNVRVPLNGIREARVAAGNEMSGCIRLFGSGGLFGWYGLFRTSGLGTSSWYVTNRANAIVLIGGKRPVLVSPDDVEGFMRVVRLTVPENGPKDSALTALGTYPAGGGAAGRVIGGVIALMAIAVATFAWTYSPGPPSYTLTPQTLEIHDRFYPVTVGANSVNVSGVRVVDLKADKDWQPTRRTNGFANDHYRAGWFRVANGKKVRMYRGKGEQLVLLPPKANGTPVLLETRDPEAFVRELKQEWGKSS